MASTSSRFTSLLVVTLLLVSNIAFLGGALAGVGGGGGGAAVLPEAAGGGSRMTVDTFGTGLPDLSYTFHGDEVRRGGWVVLENNSYVDDATVLVRGLPRTAGTKEYPRAPEVDFGDDGDIEWAFNYPAAGKLGYQYLLSNGKLSKEVTATASVEENSTTFRLPATADVTNATLNIEGRFRLEGKVLINGTKRDDELGRSLSFVGDLDGDTWPDFAVGIPLNDTTDDDNRGRVFVYFGGAGLDATPDLVLTGTNDGDQFGFNVAPAGDVNNDGYDDLLIGVPYNDSIASNCGKVYIYYGGDPMDNAADVTMIGENVGDLFGWSATGIGDINGDGYDDVASSSPNWRYNIGENTYIHGWMYIYFGGDPMDNVADLSWQGPTVHTTWAWAMAPAGDVNDDDYDDFIVGTRNNDAGCAGCGRVELFLGAASPDSTADLIIYGTNGEMIGNSLAPLGDINKDGYDDFIVGAEANKVHGTNAGAAYVYLGGSPVNGNADLTLHGQGVGEWFGCDVSPGGDINKDGWLDFLVGAEMNDSETAVDVGGVFVYFGGSALDNESDLVLRPGQQNDRFGSAISGGVDIDKDGFSDMLVGAFQNDSKASNGGRAYLLTTVPRRAEDPVLDLSGPADPPGDIWSYSGMFIGNETVPDFADALDAYLADASATAEDEYGNPYLDIAVGVTSAHDAEFIISNISIRYVYDAVIDVNPNILTGSLQKELDGMIPHQDTGTTDVLIWARSRTEGKLMFHGLDIVLDDGPHVVSTPAPTMSEDTIEPHLIDLYDVYLDEYDPDDFLTYEIVSFTGGSLINVTLNDTHFVSVDALTGDYNDNYTGTIDVVAKATDTRGLSKVSPAMTVTIAAVNDAPVFTSVPPTTATATKPYSYEASVVDAEGGVTFSLATAPNGMTVGVDTGVVIWTPPSVGDFDVSLVASDGELSVSQDFTITVSPPNEPPAITSTPGHTATVGFLYSYQLTAIDADGDDLTAELVEGPQGMTLEDDWMVLYIPSADQVGMRSVRLNVTDGTVTVSQAYGIDVTATGMNNLPVFVSTPPTTAVVGHAYDYTLVATDDDNDLITYSLDICPAGMTLRGDLVEWVPSEDQAGSHRVRARASDNKGYTFQAFDIEVTATGMNHAPVIVSTPPTTAKVGHTYEYDVQASDDDLDAITYSMDTVHKRMTIDAATGLIVWHPASDETGNQTLTVRASDGKGFGTQTFVVFVDKTDRNALPIFLSTPPKTAKVGEAYSYAPQAQDPDMDPITFRLLEGPDGMTMGQGAGGQLTWTPVPGQEGNATVVIEASDGMGFALQAFTIVVEGGDIIPVLSVAITYPNNGAVVNGTVTLEGTAGVSVGDLFEVQLKFDNGMWKPAKGLETWSYVWETSGLKNGPHNITARSWDGERYSDPVTIDITVKNVKGEPDDGGGGGFKVFGIDGFLFLLILIVLVIIIVGIGYAFKKPPQPVPPAAGRRRRERDGGDGRRPPRRSERYDDRDRRRDERYRDGGYDEDYDEGEGYDEGHEEGYDEEGYGDGYDDGDPYEDDYRDRRY